MDIKTINEKFSLKAFLARSESGVCEDKSPVFSKDAAEIVFIFLIYAAIFCLVFFLTLEFLGLIIWCSGEAAFFPFYSEPSGIAPDLTGENLRLSR